MEIKKIDLDKYLLILLSFVFFIPHFFIPVGNFFTFFSGFIYYFSIVYFIFFIVFIFYNKKKIYVFSTLSKILLVLILFLLLSSLLSEDPATSLLGWFYREKGVVFIVAMYTLIMLSPSLLNSYEKIKKFIDMGIIFMSIFSIVSILQFFGVDPYFVVYSSYGGRSFSFFYNSNWFSPVVLMFFYLSISKVFLENKYIHVIPSVIFLITIITTQTLTTYIAILVSFPIYIYLILKNFKEKRESLIKILKYILTGLLILGLIFSLFVIKYQPQFLERLSNLTTLKTRLYLWRDSLRMIKNDFSFKDYLFGIGPEMMNKRFMPYKSSELEHLEPDRLYDNAHNEYLDLFIRIGILGFSIYIVLNLYILLSLFRVFKKDNSIPKEVKFLSFSFFAALFPYLLNFFGTYETIQMVLIYAFLLSLINSLLILYKKPKETPLKIEKAFIVMISILLIFNLVYATFNFYAMRSYNSGISKLGFSQYIKDVEPEESMKNLKEAETSFKRSIKLNPFEGSFFSYNLARTYYLLYLATGDKSYSKKSIEILNSSLKRTQYPNAVYNLLGDNYYALKDIEKSIECYKNSIKWYKFFNPPILSLSKIYLEKGELEKAKSYLDIILSVKENKEAYRYMGLIYIKKGKLNTARDFLKKAISLGDKEAKEILDSLSP